MSLFLNDEQELIRWELEGIEYSSRESSIYKDLEVREIYGVFGIIIYLGNYKIGNGEEI